MTNQTDNPDRPRRRNRGRQAAIALTGAVALASGAYALGSQAGDGSAVANDPPATTADPGERMRFAHRTDGPGEHLESLADRLGVEESALRDAFRDLRPALADRHEDFAEDLAQELGIEADRLEAALERVRERHMREAEQRHEQLAQRLADRLNLDPEDVEEALGDGPFGRHPAPPPRP
jgi:hypothetical protein